MSFCDSVRMTVSRLLWGSRDDSCPDKDLSTCSSALEGAEAVIDPRTREWRLQPFHSPLPLMCDNTNALYFLCACVCVCGRFRFLTYLHVTILARSVLLFFLPPCSLHFLSSSTTQPNLHLLPHWSTEPIQADRVGSLLRLQWSVWFRWWPGYGWHEGKWDLTVRAVGSKGSAE